MASLLSDTHQGGIPGSRVFMCLALGDTVSAKRFLERCTLSHAPRHPVVRVPIAHVLPALGAVPLAVRVGVRGVLL